MTDRLKSILSGAAALVVTGGIALGVALQQSAQTEGLSTCEQWDKLVTHVMASRPVEPWFVAVQNGYLPPEAVGDRVIGTRTGDIEAGAFEALPQACGGHLAITYSYRRSGALGGWRMYLMTGDPYFARSWQVLAGTTAEVRYFGGWADVVAGCLDLTTGANCRTLLSGISNCWRRTDGYYCRDGLLYGPGLGGVNTDGSPATCSPGATDIPFPCRDLGRGPGWAETAVTEPLDVSEE